MAGGETWAQWKERTFGTGYMIWHDGLYVDAVTGLRGEARAEAVAMLRRGLAEGDPHAAEALAAMGEVGEAAAIGDTLAAADAGSRVRIALALHALRPDPALASHLAVVLRSSASWSMRIDAAIGLRQFAGADDEAALLDAVEDAKYLVRYHACESLLVRWRVQPAAIVEHRALFERIRGTTEGGPDAADRAHFAEGRVLLQALAPRTS